CDQAMNSMIGPLLAALAQALAALMAANKTDDSSKGNAPFQMASTDPTQMPVASTPAAKTADEYKLGKALFKDPTVQKGVAAIENGGGKVSEKGVTLPGEKYKEWGSLVKGSGTSPIAGAGSALGAGASGAGTGVTPEYGGGAHVVPSS